ncbi:MAG: hypothetical protein C4297_07085 [Gemmataceae bacterium]
MPDLTSFDGVFGTPRSPEQLLAILEKIDLAIYNLLNTDKNAGVTYRVGDRIVDRDGYLAWLLQARRLYGQLLASVPVWSVSRWTDEDM